MAGKPQFLKLSELFWCPKIEKTASIDFEKLAEDLAARSHEARDAKRRGEHRLPPRQLQASCQQCGWCSGPSDARDELERSIESQGGQVTYGGVKVTAQCPMCFAPVTEETIS